MRLRTIRWLAVLGSCASPLAAQAPDLARADSLWAAGQRAAARAHYEAALGQDPTLSRAVFRVAVLTPSRDSALALYRRYTILEPGDPWGWLALGAHLEMMGRDRQAIGAYHRAAATAQDDGPDAVRDAAAALLAARRRHAPAFEPLIGGSTDSDRYRTLVLGLAADVAVADGMRLGARVRRHAAHAPDQDARGDEAAATLMLRRGGARLDLTAGGLRLDPRDGAPATTTELADARLRWRGGAGRPSIDALVRHQPLLATPELIANRVERTEGRLGLELPAARWRLRAIGRGGRYSSEGHANTRMALDAIVAHMVGPAAELSLQYHRMGFADPSAAGYFSPRRSEIAEVGGYLELGGGEPVTLALDLGGGAQRTERHGEPVSAWRLAVRGYAYLVWTLAPGREFRLEAEAYNAPGLATAEVPDVGAWRYLGVTAAVRVGW